MDGPDMPETEASKAKDAAMDIYSHRDDLLRQNMAVDGSDRLFARLRLYHNIDEVITIDVPPDRRRAYHEHD